MPPAEPAPEGDMVTLIPMKTWDAIWLDYLRGGTGATFAALAEAHGVSRQAISLHAKARGWEKARRVHQAQERVRYEEEGLAYSRRLAVEIARHVARLCRDPKASLATLHAEIQEAHIGL